MVNILENGDGDPSSNLDEAVCIQLCANVLGKDMNPYNLLNSYVSILGLGGLFSCDKATSWGEGKTGWEASNSISLKNICNWNCSTVIDVGKAAYAPQQCGIFLISNWPAEFFTYFYYHCIVDRYL